MKKALVIVESPAKAKTINKFIGAAYTIKSSMGHIRDLPVKSLGIDIDKDFQPKYQMMPAKKKLISELKKAAESADQIFLAPDPDREGEAIAWHLSEIFKSMNKDIYRVSFNEITKSAVREAFVNPGRIDMLKVNSQQARRILDRIVGYKISPFLWKKVTGGLSAGRVQSVAMKLICERETEVVSFVPEEYWTITAELLGVTNTDIAVSAKLEKKNGEKIEIPDEKTTNEILERINGKPFVTTDIASKNTNRNPAPPFITSTLQQAMNNRMKWPIAKVMKIAQELYEGLDIGDEGRTGLITYMRTDSVRVANIAVDEVREFIAGRYGKEFVPAKPNFYRSKKSAQEAHEAIRPTSVMRTPESIAQFLSREQLLLYRLIWERFTASQMERARLKSTTATISVEEYQFIARGLEILFKGFMAVYDQQQDEDKEKDGILPEIKLNDEFKASSITPKQNFTKPPPRYTEASLVKILEEKGIGRPSTYASIIQTLYTRNYVIKETGKIMPTELGKIVTDILVKSFADIINVAFTAQMEEQLDDVEEGKTDDKNLLKTFYDSFSQTLEQAYSTVTKVKLPEPKSTGEKCEKCGCDMVIRSGRNGEFIACSGFPKCKNTKPIPTGVDCPDCGSALVKRKSKKGRAFYGCSNYPKCNFAASSLKKIKAAHEAKGGAAPEKTEEQEQEKNKE